MSETAGSPGAAGDGHASGDLGGAGSSRWVDIDGPVHYVDFGGPSHGPQIVCVHGLAGSAVNWSAIAPLLTSRCRVLALDLAGHGLTRSHRRGTDVKANRILLDRFIETAAEPPVILMGNSMGGMISLLEAGAAADRVSGLILIDPALPFVPARPDLLVATMFVAGGVPGLGPALLRGVHRLPPAAVVASTLALCCHDPTRVPTDVVAQHVALARRRAGFTEAGHDMGVATRSVILTAGLGGHAYRAGIAALTCPVLLVHGEKDRLVPASAARAAARAHPLWSLVILPDVGHVPQLEAPSDCATAILAWLDSAGQTAASGATPTRMTPARTAIRRWHVQRRKR
ncbi:MAG TPA: alpha/beta hydrolase [Streptosporangiaceae bacterium]|nr:alpha/beta hydrolase [Streptosporangiaceae bacterium]